MRRFVVKHVKMSARLLITQHFDNIINAIDILTEECLCDQSLTEAEIAKLNNEREEEIEVVNKICARNIGMIRNVWSEKIAELIQTDCILFRDPCASIKKSIAIFPQYFPPDKMYLLEELADWSVPWDEKTIEQRCHVGLVVCYNIPYITMDLDFLNFFSIERKQLLGLFKIE